MSQHITVVDYNPLWPKKYEEEALLIKVFSQITALPFIISGVRLSKV